MQLAACIASARPNALTRPKRQSNLLLLQKNWLPPCRQCRSLARAYSSRPPKPSTTDLHRSTLAHTTGSSMLYQRNTPRLRAPKLRQYLRCPGMSMPLFYRRCMPSRKLLLRPRRLETKRRLPRRNGRLPKRLPMYSLLRRHLWRAPSLRVASRHCLCGLFRRSSQWLTSGLPWVPCWPQRPYDRRACQAAGASGCMPLAYKRHLRLRQWLSPDLRSACFLSAYRSLLARPGRGASASVNASACAGAWRLGFRTPNTCVAQRISAASTSATAARRQAGAMLHVVNMLII